MSEPEPTAEESVTRATSALGEPERMFRASPNWQRAKFLAALGMIVFGIVANGLWFGVGPARADHFLLHFLLLPPAIGFGLLWHMWRHRGLRVLLYPEGLLRIQHGEAESFPWDDITSIRFKIILDGKPHIERDENGDVVEVWFGTSTPTFQVWNVWLEVTRSDETSARFTAALADFPELIEQVQRRTFPAMWTAAQATLDEGKRVTFGEHITVTREAVSSAKYSVKWAEMKPASLSSSIYIVKRQGAWATAIVREHSTIANYHVLAALTAELGIIEETDEEPRT